MWTYYFISVQGSLPVEHDTPDPLVHFHRITFNSELPIEGIFSHTFHFEL